MTYLSNVKEGYSDNDFRHFTQVKMNEGEGVKTPQMSLYDGGIFKNFTYKNIKCCDR